MGPTKTSKMVYPQELLVPQVGQALHQEQASQDWELFQGVDDVFLNYFRHDEFIEDFFNVEQPLPELLIDLSDLEEGPTENDLLSPVYENSFKSFLIEDLNANYVDEMGKVLEKAELESSPTVPDTKCPVLAEKTILKNNPLLTSKPKSFDVFEMEFNSKYPPNELKLIMADDEKDEEVKEIKETKVTDELKESLLSEDYEYRNASLSPEGSSSSSYTSSDDNYGNLFYQEPMECFETSVTNTADSVACKKKNVSVIEESVHNASLNSEEFSMTSDLSSDDTNDPEWSSIEFAKKKGAVGKTRKPYKKLKSAVERHERKKEQNRNAATRYRMKKKQELSAISKEEEILLERKKSMEKQLDAFKTEYNNIKKLFCELTEQKGLIKKVSGKWVWA